MDRQEVIEKIERDCQPFLSLVGPLDVKLYRGAAPEAPVAFEGVVFRDRKPKNMPIDLHQAADAWFSTQFGVRYRGAGLLCTGDPAQAGSHGKVYSIHPIGGFQFCWSPLVRDLHEWCAEKGYLHQSPEALVEALNALDYREERIGDAINSGCEIMIACKRYHAVDVAGF